MHPKEEVGHHSSGRAEIHLNKSNNVFFFVLPQTRKSWENLSSFPPLLGALSGGVNV